MAEEGIESEPGKISRTDQETGIDSKTGKPTLELLETQKTISEITYEFGFGDPCYFSKQFKAEFQVLQSKIRENQGASLDN